ncbi:MAG: FAD binding domain-containing protein, partial [Hoeflea sp.]
MTSTVLTVATMGEAARAVAQGATFFGGGTIVMRDVNAGTAAASIVRTTDPSLREIRISGDTVTLGAGVTMASVLANRDLEFLHPVARLVGGPQIRNMGTVGGNLFAPHPYGDFAVALLALGARVV